MNGLRQDLLMFPLVASVPATLATESYKTFSNESIRQIQKNKISTTGLKTDMVLGILVGLVN